MTTPSDIRWQQRLQNFSRAFKLLREIVEAHDDLTALEAIVKEGTIQRFEYTFELAWKTLKDKMEADGLELERISPRYVFKTAYQSKYIDDIDGWLKMAGDRNLMSHTYNFDTFDQVLITLKNEYFQLLSDLHVSLIEQQLEG